MRKSLGAQVRGLRKVKGLTQEKFSESAELSYKYIGELERGEVNISLDSIVKIADALGVKAGDLFSKETVLVQKVYVKEKSLLSNLSSGDISSIKAALKLLNKIFAKL